MQISVIIPVYNAADYVQQAVESALDQPETAEVILVEDGSSDNSLAVCQKLASTYPRVQLYRHPDGKNLGAGATRNLAIQKSNCDYVAFLDADDFFLPGRFSVARELFETDPELEGVYEAIAMHVEDKVGAQRWNMAGRRWDRLHTMTERVSPEELFEALIKGGKGSFSIDGLVVKRAVFTKTGLLDEHLRLHQDTAIIIKIAALAKLKPGRLNEPVAKWRVHDHNRISAPRPPSQVYRGKLKYWHTLWNWSKERLDWQKQQIVLDALLRHGIFSPRFDKSFSPWTRGLQKRVQLALLPLDVPALIREPVFWRHFVPSPRHWGRKLHTWLFSKAQA